MVSTMQSLLLMLEEEKHRLQWRWGIIKSLRSKTLKEIIHYELELPLVKIHLMAIIS